MADIKLTFIQNCLTDYMQRVQAAMEGAGTKNKIEINSISYNIIQSGGGFLGQLSFNNYLRFVDMGVGRGHPLGGLAATSASIQSVHKKGADVLKNKIRKPKKIYAKPAFGELGYLYGKLRYGFSAETIAMIKAQLEQGNDTSA